eukprot:9070467-Alexandrium_andersonii.AAC.1
MPVHQGTTPARRMHHGRTPRKTRKPHRTSEPRDHSAPDQVSACATARPTCAQHPATQPPPHRTSGPSSRRTTHRIPTPAADGACSATSRNLQT